MFHYTTVVLLNMLKYRVSVRAQGSWLCLNGYLLEMGMDYFEASNTTILHKTASFSKNDFVNAKCINSSHSINKEIITFLL